jgi:multicomponent Na+:H+ antiporter subunit C
METIFSILVGLLFGAAVFLVLQRSIIRILIGLVLISQAANLLVFTSSGARRTKPPIIPDHEAVLTAPFADPLPQALILTAIVISFGVLAFSLVLFYRTDQEAGTDDVDEMKGENS